MAKGDMLAAVLESQNPNRYTVKRVPIPTLGADEVLIKVARCGICMTDVHAFEGRMPVKPPVILGHEFVGTIVEVGGQVKAYANQATSDPVKVGDKVSVIPMISCRHCPACTSGRTNLCPDYTSLGGAAERVIDGGFAEYVKAPIASVFKVPQDMPYKLAAMIEVLACCIHGVDLSGIRQGDTVVLIGAGAVGLLLLQLIRLQGAARIIALDLRQDRRDLALNLGADLVFDPTAEDPAVRISHDNGGTLADVVIEAVGSSRAVELALNVVRKGGRVNIFGVADNNALCKVSPFDIYFRELTVVGTFALTLETFSRSLAMLAGNRIDVTPIITEELPLTEIRLGVEMMIKNEGLKKHIVFE